MMVGEGARLAERKAGVAKAGEEFLGASDAGESDVGSGSVEGAKVGCQLRAQDRECPGQHRGRPVLIPADHDGCLAAGGGGGHGLAEWADGQQASIAEAGAAADHQQGAILDERRVLQIPEQSHRRHFVKAKVRVHEYPDGTLAIFHGPRRLARYTADGTLNDPDTITRSAA